MLVYIEVILTSSQGFERTADGWDGVWENTQSVCFPLIGWDSTTRIDERGVFLEPVFLFAREPIRPPNGRICQLPFTNPRWLVSDLDLVIMFWYGPGPIRRRSRQWGLFFIILYIYLKKEFDLSINTNLQLIIRKYWAWWNWVCANRDPTCLAYLCKPAHIII